MSKVALQPPIAVSAAQPCTTACALVTGSEFLLVLWVDEGSASVIPFAKIVGDAVIEEDPLLRVLRKHHCFVSSPPIACSFRCLRVTVSQSSHLATATQKNGMDSTI